MRKLVLSMLLLFVALSAKSQFSWITTSVNARYTGSGNVVIGISTSPAAAEKLQVLGSIRAQTNLMTDAGIIVSGTSSTSPNMIFRTFTLGTATDRITILGASGTTAGFVGIGNSGPSERLHVTGNTRTSGNLLTDAGIIVSGTSSTSPNMTFRTFTSGNATDRLTILGAAGATAGFVGIGTATPTNRLDVMGSTLNRISAGVTADVQTGYQAVRTGTNATNWEMYVPAGSTDFRFNNLAVGDILSLKSDGKIGIGTTSPAELLHVNGNIRGNQDGAIRISTGSGYVDVGPRNSGFAHFYTDRPSYFFDKKIWVDEGIITSYDEDLNLQTAGNTRLTILNSNGNVGIGTTTPGTFKLAVNGAIAGKDLQIINTSGPTWPDYVFSKEYQLPSLQAVEKYITENNHLEGVPSAQEVKENGYSAATLDQALLKKVEELTLYVIEQQKQIEALQQEVAKKKRSRK